MASARTSLPSASVFVISTVLPSALTITSPGRCAAPPGMFSVAATTAITFEAGLRAPITSMAASTAAAPAMSAFIRCMSLASLREIPPVSKVMPLPTSASSEGSGSPSAGRGAPRWRRRIRRGGCEEPAATPRSRL